MGQADSQGLESCHDGGGITLRESQEAPSGTGRAIRSCTTVPPTVLIAEPDNGTLILQGRSDGSCLYLRIVDAVPLRHELAKVFDSLNLTPGDGQGDAS